MNFFLRFIARVIQSVCLSDLLIKSSLLCRDKVVDFHWNAFDPWTIVSVSDDCDTTGGGGTLQVSGC